MTYTKKMFFAAAGAALCVFPAAFSQEQEEDVFVLSEFVVQGQDSATYVASESVTGTRVATRIADLPFPINVVTSDFMTDFAMFDLADDVAYTSSLTGLDTQGNFQMRGYGATFYLRNGFYRLGLVDRVNIDRIEIIKGPNAAIYGATSPAGIVNMVTTRPSKRPYQKGTLTVGSDDMRRGEININGGLGRLGEVDFSHVFSASLTDRGYDEQFGELKQRLFSEAILAEFSDNSSLLTEIEYSERNKVQETSKIPYVYADRKYTDQLVPEVGLFSQSGPNAINERDMLTVTTTYEKRFNQVWSMRVSGYMYDRTAYKFNTGSSDKFDIEDRTFTYSKPSDDTLAEDGAALQADLLAHYYTGDGRMEHKTLITVDLSQNNRNRVVLKAPDELFPRTVSLDDPDYSLPSMDNFNIVSRNDDVTTDVQGFFIRQQTSMMNRRLLGFAGVRFDRVEYDMNFGDQYSTGRRDAGELDTPGMIDRFSDTAWSPSLGFNFKATENVAVYVNRSRSFYPNAQVAKLGDPRLDNETGDGWDAGFKVSAFDDRLNFTLGGYKIDREGVKVRQEDEEGNTETVAGGSQSAEGVELDFTWQATDNLTLLGGFGTTDAVYVWNGENIDSVGRNVEKVPLENGGLALKYKFSGPLDGFSWNFGVKYTGESYPESASGDARVDLRLPSYTTYDTGLSYRWGGGEDRSSHTLRFSVKNLTEKEYIDYRLNIGDDRKFYLSYSYRN